MIIHDSVMIMEFNTVTSKGLSPTLGRWWTDAVAGPRRRWIAVVVVCLGQLMIAVDATIVNVALPSIQQDLGFSRADLTWVVNAYLLTFGGFLLLAGRLGDLIGRKRVFLGGLVVFTARSGLCRAARSQAGLVARRRPRLGLGAHARPRRPRARPRRGLHRPRGAAREPDHAAADPAGEHAGRHEHRPRAARRRHVLLVLLRRAVARARARLRRGRHGRRVP